MDNFFGNNFKQTEIGLIPDDWELCSIGDCFEIQQGKEDIDAAVRSDPDNPPLTPEREPKLRPIPRVKTLRHALGLTQEEFAARYHIPLGTLRDWEQGRSQPDQPARAFLAVIARAPEEVATLLSK